MVWPRAKPSFAPTLIRHLKIFQAKCMVKSKGQFVFGYQKLLQLVDIVSLEGQHAFMGDYQIAIFNLSMWVS